MAGLVLQHLRRLDRQAVEKARDRTLSGSRCGYASANSANRVTRRCSLSGVSGGGSPTAAARRSTGNSSVRSSGQPPGPVGAREAGDGSQQRPIVISGPRHLVVQALVVLRLDSVGAKSDSLADQNAGTGGAVVVGEQRTRHHDRETRCQRQRCELHLRFHLGPAAVTDRVVEVAGELHEQLRVETTLCVRVLDIQQHLASGATAGDVLAPGDPRDRRLKCAGQEGDSGVPKGGGIRGERQPRLIAGDPAVAHQVCSAARTRISLTATRRSRVTM